ncbi:MAG: FliM/FliN family flagellar motor switch protein [Parasphingorhabdus sp.]
MSNTSNNPQQTNTDDTGINTAPVEHSLLKKSGPDDELLRIYRKVEKKIEGALKTELAKVIDVPVKMELVAGEKTGFTEWLDNQETDSIYLQFHVGVSDTPLWARVERLFLNACVDCFFGGQFDSQSTISGKLKRSEIAMIERLARVIGGSLTRSWSVICETPVRYAGYVHGKDEVEMDLDEPDVLVAKVNAGFSEDQIDAIDLVQSIDGLVEIEPQLNRSTSKEVTEIDPVWQHSLKESVEEVFLPVRSVLGRPTMQLSQLSRLTVGDILPVAPTDNVPLIVGDRVFAQGSIGEQNGGVAFQIKHFL